MWIAYKLESFFNVFRRKPSLGAPEQMRLDIPTLRVNFIVSSNFFLFSKLHITFYSLNNSCIISPLYLEWSGHFK